MPRICKLLLVPLTLLLAAWFSFVALHRFIDADEGYYLVASRLVLLHKIPYLDFFYTQAPLLPYAYAGWLKLFGISWISARIFAAMLTTLLGILLSAHVCRETRRWQAGLCAVVLFASATYIFAWFPIAKTFSLASLFLFGAYSIVGRLGPASSKWLVAGSGALFGLSVETRSYLLLLTPLFLWWLLKSSAAGRMVRMAYFLGGSLLAGLPSMVLLAVSPSQFLFGNLGYHALRANEGLLGMWRWKVHVVRLVLFGAQDSGLQFTILAVVGFVLILLLRTRRSSAVFAFLIAVVVGVISILPTPPLTQYFCLCMPFLIVSAVCGANDYWCSLRSSTAKWAMALVGCGLAAVFAVLSASAVRNYLVSGENVIGMSGARDAGNWTLERVRLVSERVDQLSSVDDEVVSFWPGYIFQSKVLPYPGFENDFGRIVSEKLTAEQRARYRLVSRLEIGLDFAAQRPRICILGNQGNSGGGRPYYSEMLRERGYSRVESIGDTAIYVRGSGR